jgi:hypothetical protein
MKVVKARKVVKFVNVVKCNEGDAHGEGDDCGEAIPTFEKGQIAVRNCPDSLTHNATISI